MEKSSDNFHLRFPELSPNGLSLLVVDNIFVPKLMHFYFKRYFQLYGKITPIIAFINYGKLKKKILHYCYYRYEYNSTCRGLIEKCIYHPYLMAT